MTVPILQMAAVHFSPRKVVYLDALGLLPLYEGLAFRAPTVVCGPKGVAKTLSLQHFAYQVKSPIITFDCSEDIRRAHLIGMHIPRGDEAPFVLGPITNAFEIANEEGRCILCLEELNSLSPQSQKLLNAASDWRQRLEVPEAQRVFELQPGKQLWVTGTMNDSAYGGVYALNEDLKSRFRVVSVDYPTPKAEKRIIQKVLRNSVRDQVVTQVLTLAHETRQGAFDYALSTRDVVQILEDVAAMDLPRALRVAIGKFEGADQDTVKERVNSLFGVSLKEGNGG